MYCVVCAALSAEAILVKEEVVAVIEFRYKFTLNEVFE